MIKINLIPPEYIERINRKAVIAKAVLAGVIVVATLVVVSLWHITRAKTIESTLAKRTIELKILQKDVDQVKAIEAQIAEVQRYLDSIASINKGRFTYTHFLQDIVSDLPATIWFSGLSTSLSGDSIKVDLSVNSNSAYDLAYWINSLETSGPYSEVGIGGISVSNTEDGKRFTVPISVRYAHR
jgi:Tfp pilus assembly protein PilN